jgi:hypothetical protein
MAEGRNLEVERDYEKMRERKIPRCLEDKVAKHIPLKYAQTRGREGNVLLSKWLRTNNYLAYNGVRNCTVYLL